MENNINEKAHSSAHNNGSSPKKDWTILVALIGAFGTITAVLIPLMWKDGCGRKPEPEPGFVSVPVDTSKPTTTLPFQSGGGAMSPAVHKATVPSSVQYFNKGLPANVAFLENTASQIPNVVNYVESLFSNNGVRGSNHYFLETFRKKINHSIKNINLEELGAMGLPAELKCICQFSEVTNVKETMLEGREIKVAHTDLQIYLLNLKNGNMDNIKISMSGSGISEGMALESLEEHLLASDKLKNINFMQCK